MSKSVVNRIINRYASQITIVAVILVLGVILSFLTPYFFTFANISNILVAVTVSGTIAAGLTVIMIMGCMDLAQYSAMAMVGVIVATLLKSGMNGWLGIMVAILLGVLTGAINGFIVTKMQIAPMVGTIATQLMFRACAYMISSGQNISIYDDVYKKIGFGKVFNIPILVIILLIVYIVISYILRNTAFGRYTYAVGGNPIASELSGININKMKFIGYLIGGATAGLACVLQNSQIGCAMPGAGAGNEMDGITAVVLGGVALTGGKGYVWGSLAGVLLLQVLSNGMTLLSVPPYFQQFLKGMVLLVSVYSDVVRTNKAKKA